ncbi:MAG: tyrosine-type recombinase/integrase [Terriglobales bacterium]
MNYYLRHCGQLADSLGNITLGAITADVIASYQQKRMSAGASPRTVNMEVGTLRSVMIHARLWANIAPDVHMLREPAPPGVAITHEQEEVLLAACAASRSPSLYTFIVLAIETGTRRGVIRTLQWKRVDFANRCLTWGKDKTPAGTGRVVPLSARAVAVLTDWAAQFPACQPGHFVFPTMSVGGSGMRGTQCARQAACFVGGIVYDVDPARPIGGVTSAWEAARERAGLRIRIHDCRHLAASRMLDAGVPIA